MLQIKIHKKTYKNLRYWNFILKYTRYFQDIYQTIWNIPRMWEFLRSPFENIPLSQVVHILTKEWIVNPQPYPRAWQNFSFVKFEALIISSTASMY